MTSAALAWKTKFLQSYSHDVSQRWSAADIAAQQAFVAQHLPAYGWLDWSTPDAALHVLQACMFNTPLAADAEHASMLIAGPVADLIPPDQLFTLAARQLRPGGHLVGLIPCVRDNSPQNQHFIDLTAKISLPYTTVEDLADLARSAEFQIDKSATTFVPIPQLIDAARLGQLGFDGWSRCLAELQSQGFDPHSVSWGELHIVASLNPAE